MNDGCLIESSVIAGVDQIKCNQAALSQVSQLTNQLFHNNKLTSTFGITSVSAVAILNDIRVKDCRQPLAKKIKPNFLKEHPRLLSKKMLQRSAIRPLAYAVFAHWLCAMRVRSKLQGLSLPTLKLATLAGVFPSAIQQGLAETLNTRALNLGKTLTQSLHGLFPNGSKRTQLGVSFAVAALPLAIEDVLATQYCYSKMMGQPNQLSLSIKSISLMWFIHTLFLILSQGSQRAGASGQSQVRGSSHQVDNSQVHDEDQKKKGNFLNHLLKNPNVRVLLLSGCIEGMIDYLVASSHFNSDARSGGRSEQLIALMAYIALGVATQLLLGQGEKITRSLLGE